MTEPTTKDLPARGSFPKGTRGETVAQRRERYELWVLGTYGGKPDYEVQSVRFYRSRGAGSLALCTASRCWQCVAGDDDANGQQRVADCTNRDCGLWRVRPYQVKPEQRASRPPAVRAYCSDCVGRVPGGTWKEVEACHAVACAIWPVRPGNWAENAPAQESELEHSP